MSDELRRDWRASAEEGGRSSDAIFLLVLLALALAGVAAVIDAEAAGVGLLVEGSALLLGVVLAFRVGEKLLRWDRQQRWRGVRDQLADTVTHHVVNLAKDFEEVLITEGGGIARGVSSLDALESASNDPVQIRDALRTLLANVQAAADRLSRSEHSDVSTGAALLARIGIHSRPLLSALLSRVIAVADDPKLVEPLLELERNEYKWRIAILYVEQFALGDTGAWDAAAATLASAARVYEAFHPPAV